MLFVRNEETRAGEIYLDGEIRMEEDWFGPPASTPNAFRRRLMACDSITVYINSPGGDVFAAADMYTALKEHKGRVTVKISGIAASAASLVAMAGDEVLMSPVAYMMIHDPWTMVAGNARELDHQAAILREIGEGLITAYATKTGKARPEIEALLQAETYMSAARCVQEGFADGILYEAPQENAKTRDGSMMQARLYNSPSACLALMAGHGAPAAMPEPPPFLSGARQALHRRALLIASLYPEEEKGGIPT